MKKLLFAVLMALSMYHLELNAQISNLKINNANGAYYINNDVISKTKSSKFSFEKERKQRLELSREKNNEILNRKEETAIPPKGPITNPRHFTKPASASMKGGMPNDPFFKFQYGLTQTRIYELWNMPVKNSRRPIIAFIGTGVEYDHPDLVDNMWQNEEEVFGETGVDDDGDGYIDDYFGWNFIDNDNNINDESGLDTYCAGVAAAVGNNKKGIIGANPDAIILPIKIATSNSRISADKIIQAINYACAKGADVIHISSTNIDNITPELIDLLNSVSKSKYLVAPAYTGGDPITMYCAYPASLPCVIGVEASDSLGNRYINSDYDNDGRYFSTYTNNLNYELRAPGDNILTTSLNGNYDMASNTYLASAIVAGAISRLISVKDYDDPRTLITQLIESQDNNGGIVDFMATYLTNEKKQGIKLSSLTISDSENIITDHTLSDGTQYEIYLSVRNFYGENGNISIHIGFEDENDADLINIMSGNDITLDTTLNSYEYAVVPQKILIQTKDGYTTSEPIKLKISVTSDIGSDTILYNLNIVGQPIYDSYLFNIISEENCEAEVCGITEEKTSLNIPSSVTYKNKNYIVTKIANYAFKDNVNITSSVNIPQTINHIGEEAFKGCYNIKEIYFYSQIQNIENHAFSGCTSIRYVYSFIEDLSLDNIIAEKIPSGAYYYYFYSTYFPGEGYHYNLIPNEFTIPEGVISLGKKLFANYNSVGTIYLPESLSSIGEGAFSNCANLYSVYFGKNIKKIGPKAFLNCSYLSHLSNTSKIEEIGEKAFCGCSMLQSINLPSVKHIERNAFYSCGNLLSAETGSSLQSIGEQAFMSCSQLSKFVMSNNVETIGDSAFYDCAKLTNINLPTSLKKINKATFRNCSSLNINKIPDNVEQIEDEAFFNCANIKSLTIGNSIKTIGDNAFYQCKDINNIQINGQLESLGTRAFYTCSSLSSINIPNSVKTIGTEAFKKCDNLPITNDIRYADTYLAEVTNKNNASYMIKNGTRFITENAFENCKTMATIELPTSIEHIGEKAFLRCEQLKSITIPEGVEKINTSTFEECASLHDVSLPRSLRFIDNNAFYSCESIESIIIPDSVVSLGERSFCNCSSMTSVNIPENVKSIGTRAFHYCRNLPVTDNIRYADTYLLEATDNSLTNYNIKGNTRFIANNAFAKCKNMTSINIPATVTYIGSSAFSSCTSLDSIIINNEEPFEVDNTFITSKDRKNITIYVPTGCLDAYSNSIMWQGFKDIVEFNPTDITDIIKRGNSNNSNIFNLLGQKLNRIDDAHGIVIIEGKKYLK